ncbi:hypothetical protein BDZ91DRAFT_78904 [Kalaharituber pfeilii]|nr:hypothetical protein BDZ91DRAFT_78904 [Kalaharituber pfeilii]
MAMALCQQEDAGIMTNDSFASSGKASLTPQALRTELASAHAALLTDIDTPSLLASSTSSGPLTESSDTARSWMIESDASPGPAISCISAGDSRSTDIHSTTHFLPPPTAPTPEETSPTKGGSSTSRRQEKSRKINYDEERGKDIWEFDVLSQDPDVKDDDRNGTRRRDDTSQVSDIHKEQRAAVTISDEGVKNACFLGQPNKDRTDGHRAIKKKKTPPARRSKTSFDTYPDYNFTITEPIILPDDDNDDDYNPNKSSRKPKKNDRSKTSVSGRKKTRSNTDDWELMPALPKGTKGAQKQTAATAPDNGKSPTRSMQDKVVLCPFKIDLTLDSLLLPEEEKEKYDVFSPLNTSQTTNSQPASPAEPSLLNLPLPVSESQSASLDSIAVKTGANMSSTIPDEEYFRMAFKEQASGGRKSLSGGDPSGGEIQSTNSRSENEKRVKIIEDSDDDSPLSDLETIIKSKDMEVEPISEALSSTVRKRGKRKTASTQSSDEDIVEKAPQKHRSKRMSKKGLHQRKVDDPDDGGEIEQSQSELGWKSNYVKDRKCIARLEFVASQDQPNRKEKQPTSVVAAIAEAEQENSNERNDLDVGHKKETRLGRKSTKHSELISSDADEDDTTAVDESVSSTAVSGISAPNSKEPNDSTENIPTSTPTAVTEGLKPPPVTPSSNTSCKKVPYSPINSGKLSAVKYRVGLSKRANIESLHSYLKR